MLCDMFGEEAGTRVASAPTKMASRALEPPIRNQPITLKRIATCVTPPSVSLAIQLWPVRNVGGFNCNLVSIEEFDELLVHTACFWVRKQAVLFKDGREGPVLELTQAPDETTSSVLALITVY